MGYIPHGEDAKGVQQSFNHFNRQYGLGMPRLDVDGEIGPQTKNAIRPASEHGSKASAMFFLGYPVNGLRLPRTEQEWQRFVRRLRHPKAHTWLSPRALVRGAARRVARRKLLKKANGPLRTRALHVAQSLVGIHETGHNSGPVVSKIIRANGGLVGEAWCGDFQAYCYRLAGSKSVSRSWASAHLTGGAHHVSNPEPGDIVYFGNGGMDHVEMVEFVASNGDLHTIGGNTSCPGGEGACRKVRARYLASHFTRVDR